MVSAAIVALGSPSTLLGGRSLIVCITYLLDGPSPGMHLFSSRWTFHMNACLIYRFIYVYFFIHIARISCTRYIKPENKS